MKPRTGKSLEHLNNVQLSPENQSVWADIERFTEDWVKMNNKDSSYYTYCFRYCYLVLPNAVKPIPINRDTVNGLNEIQKTHAFNISIQHVLKMEDPTGTGMRIETYYHILENKDE